MLLDKHLHSKQPLLHVLANEVLNKAVKSVKRFKVSWFYHVIFLLLYCLILIQHIHTLERRLLVGQIRTFVWPKVIEENTIYNNTFKKRTVQKIINYNCAN